MPARARSSFPYQHHLPGHSAKQTKANHPPLLNRFPSSHHKPSSTFTILKVNVPSPSFHSRDSFSPGPDIAPHTIPDTTAIENFTADAPTRTSWSQVRGIRCTWERLDPDFEGRLPLPVEIDAVIGSYGRGGNRELDRGRRTREGTMQNERYSVDQPSTACVMIPTIHRPIPTIHRRWRRKWFRSPQELSSPPPQTRPPLPPPNRRAAVVVEGG